VLTGSVEVRGDLHGWPVGVGFDAKCALLVAYDVGDTAWWATAEG